MARHSHWHNIQITKGKADAKRAKLFSRFTRAITIAAREGGGDPNFNVRLRVAVESAKSVNVPKDNIERAILRGTGAAAGSALEEVIYETYAPGRIATMIVCTTDNRNRTAGEIKSVLSKFDSALMNPGTFSFMFERKSVVTVLASSVKSRDDFDLLLIDAGAEDIEEDEEHLRISGSPKVLSVLSETAAKAGVVVLSAKLEFLPKDPSGAEFTEETEKFLTAIDDLDDVDEVFVNA